MSYEEFKVKIDSGKYSKYYETFLCTGNFVNQFEVTIAKEFRIIMDSTIVESHEWERGFIDL